MNCIIIEQIDSIPPQAWNSLAIGGNPFLRHEFLAALEHHQCVGERYGWIPQHIVAKDRSGQVLGAMPLYLKDNSYGEFVFDWGWADAYQRAGLSYYPKLVTAIPYTPATGPRLLIAPHAPQEAVANALIDKALNLGASLNVSSLHWLFTNKNDSHYLTQKGLLTRIGCQFHWHNQNYRDFDTFLGQLSSRKRKQIKRERRHVSDAQIEMKILHGNDISEAQLHQFHHHYQSTFHRLGGYATLSEAFFREISSTLPENVVFVFAYYNHNHVASAFCVRGEDTLYGRHWGCDADFNSLHFEACYYQGIEYCIAHGLSHFEPGAQGEHKISRGFVPTATYSQHWIENEQFRPIIADYLQREQQGVRHYMESLIEHLPYRGDTDHPLSEEQRW
ncbi:GNAT family N-acetyltransferase [Kaarinaea lacus]